MAAPCMLHGPLRLSHLVALQVLVPACDAGMAGAADLCAQLQAVQAHGGGGSCGAHVWPVGVRDVPVEACGDAVAVPRPVPAQHAGHDVWQLVSWPLLHLNDAD